MPSASRFEALRPELQRLAYRMLGTRGDAEDIVQDTYLRWKQAEAEPDNLAAWLTRTCVRLCIDRLRSAQRTRETYVGPWLPEPWVEAEESIPAELDESISLAVLVLLERLKPAERAAFVLHDVFDYEFGEVAQFLGKTPANCRQLAVRARAHLRTRRPRVPVDKAEYEAVAQRFFAALRSGEIAGLREVLARDVVVQSDGGRKAIAARKPVVGADKVARFLSRGLTLVEHHCKIVWFNGAPGLVVLDHGRVVTALQLDIEAGLVVGIYAIRNPEKLQGFATLA